jgi:hypothetical protein
MIVHVSKDRSKPITFIIEPWANDYTVMPGDEFEVVPCEYMEIDQIDVGDNYVLIWLAHKEQGTGINFCDMEFKASINGKAALCGQNREHGDQW